MTEKRLLTAILLLYLLLGFTYALTTPVFEASDELWHYPMIRHLADGNPLPVQVTDPDLAGPWKQEASQPPLYYYLGAALTFWIDTSDMEEVRRENPHVDNGLITEDGNINLVVHDPNLNPWQGTLLAVRIVRLASVFLGGITVYLTYRIGKKVDESRAEIALGAAAVVAFIPMFLFISGAVNNDNLAIMLTSLALFLLIKQVASIRDVEDEEKYIEGKTGWRSLMPWITIGIVIGAAVLTKEGTFGLLPLAWGTGFVFAWLKDSKAKTNEHPQEKNTILWLGRILVKSIFYFTLVMIPVLLIGGWWYFRNIQLYGDWLGWNAFIAVLGQRGHPASLLQLWGERRGFMMAFWGLFGGVNVPMASWIYTVLNGILLLSVIGFIVYFFKLIKAWISRIRNPWRTLRGIFANLMDFISHNFAVVTSFLLAAAVVIGLIQWATTTWSSQGRLVFTALSALSVLFVLGLIGWMPRKPAKFVIGSVSSFLFLTALAAPFLWITPSYDPETSSSANLGLENNLDLKYGDSLQLNSIKIETGDPNNVVRPGDSIWIHLDWETTKAMDKDWSVFVHLTDPIIEQPIAQRDMYLGQGLILTSWLDAGEKISNSYHIQIPDTTPAPANLDVLAGFYDYNNGERLKTKNGEDAPIIGNIRIEPIAGQTPNATQINFEDQFTLIGYDIDPRRLTAGEEVELTLYWQAGQTPNDDYSFFAQIVDEDTTRWASHDYFPDEGTSNWQADQTQSMPLTLTLDAETPAKLYPIIIGIYTQTADGQFDRLQIMTEDGRLTDDFLVLTQVRVD